MAVIKVNHSTLRTVASAITTYCGKQNREMRSVDLAVKVMLATGWTGADADEFLRKWADVNSSDSVARKFRDALKGYGESITLCANEYQSAQEDAYNAANALRFISW